MHNYPNFMVCVRSLTYNHKDFITDALNGFIIQETEFPYVVCVLDDASTDGTQDVIKSYVAEQFDIHDSSIAYERETEYAYITYAQHKTNRNCYIVVHYLKYNHYQIGKKKVPYLAEWRNCVKYEALCEGDDYWIDPKKLQKQVNVLETNEDVGFVYTAFNVVDLYCNEIKYPYAEKHMGRSFSGDHFLALLYDNFPQTLTVMFRKSLYDEKQLINGIDYSLFLSLSLSTKFMYLNEKTGVYRINPLGMMQSGSVSQMDFHQLRLYYLGQYFANKRYRRSFVDHLYICKYFLFHQCHLERYRKYQSLFSVIFDNNHIIKFLFPLGLISSSIVSIKQKYEKYD